MARSLLYDVQNAQPSEPPLPVAPKSQLNGGVMICHPIDMVPSLGSTLMPMTTPLNFVAYSSSGAYYEPSGTEKRVATRAYSVLLVTMDEPWLPMVLGIGPSICLVLRSCRSIRAIRLFALSFTNSQRPS